MTKPTPINFFLAGHFALLVLMLFLAACGPADEPTPTQMVVPSPVNAYPAAGGQDSQSYPAPTSTGGEDAYPPPRRIVNESKRFTLEEPVRAGQTTVGGTGPADTPIKLISLSYAGEELAFGMTDGSGDE